MIGARLLATGALLAAFLGAPALAYTHGGSEVNGRLVFNSWPAGRLPLRFQVNDRPLSLLTNFTSDSLPAKAVENAIRSWATGTGFDVRNAGVTSVLNSAADGVNLITFADTPQNRDLVANALGLTTIWTNNNGEIGETDIVLSPRVRWATDGRAGRYDVEEVLAHELGHALGLDHSALASSTMFPWGREGSVSVRSLETDDRAGVRSLYPALRAPGVGSLTGRVTTTENRGIFGAHVVAVDVRGVVPVGVVTLPDGSFRLDGLPAGDYQLYAEPLNGPVTPPDLGGLYARGTNTFRTLFSGGNASPMFHKVTAGQTTSVGQLKVEAQAATFNPLYVGLFDRNGTAFWHVQAASVQAASNGMMLVVGNGLAPIPPDGFRVSGGDIVLDRSRVQRGKQSGYDYLAFPFQVVAGAAPGPRSIYVSTETERAVFSGALEVAAP